MREHLPDSIHTQEVTGSSPVAPTIHFKGSTPIGSTPIPGATGSTPLMGAGATPDEFTYH